MIDKKMLLDYIMSLPDNMEVETNIGTDISADNAVTESVKTEDAPEATEVTTEVAPEPSAEVNAPPVEQRDITIVNANDMVENSIDMRLASFKTKQDELENAVAILTSQVSALTEQINTIDKAVDIVANNTPVGESLDTIINRL